MDRGAVCKKARKQRCVVTKWLSMCKGRMASLHQLASGREAVTESTRRHACRRWLQGKCEVCSGQVSDQELTQASWLLDDVASMGNNKAVIWPWDHSNQHIA
eukprot:1148650-Pelagomonas_calceolata.AAC.2